MHSRVSAIVDPIFIFRDGLCSLDYKNWVQFQERTMSLILLSSFLAINSKNVAKIEYLMSFKRDLMLKAYDVHESKRSPNN